LQYFIESCVNGQDIDACISQFSDIIDDVVSPICKRVTIDSDTQQRNTHIENRWFTTECYEKRQIFYKQLNMYRQDKNENNRIYMRKARSDYKACIRKCKYEYDKLKTSELIDARFKNAKLYWKLLKGCAGVKKSTISLSVYEQYFKSVKNPDDSFFIPDEDVIHFVERIERNEFDVMFDELNVPISNECILKAIKELNTGKSADPDMLLNEFLYMVKMYCCPIFILYLTKYLRLVIFRQLGQKAV